MSLNWGALETWGRPVYDPSCAQDGGWNEVLTHEIAHFWFGDTVTLAAWRDIVINEGMATYMEEYLAPGVTRAMADSIFYSEFDNTSPGFWTSALSDPGPDPDLFSSHVYDGGAMAVHATRVLMGDDAFFDFLRAWASQTGPHSLADWRAMAQEYSPVDLAPAHAVWFEGTTRVVCSPDLGCP
jgi:aminopeptidase N